MDIVSIQALFNYRIELIKTCENIHSHKLLVVCIYITDNVGEFVIKLICNNHFSYLLRCSIVDLQYSSFAHRFDNSNLDCFRLSIIG